MYPANLNNSEWVSSTITAKNTTTTKNISKFFQHRKAWSQKSELLELFWAIHLGKTYAFQAREKPLVLFGKTRPRTIN